MTFNLEERKEFIMDKFANNIKTLIECVYTVCMDFTGIGLPDHWCGTGNSVRKDKGVCKRALGICYFGNNAGSWSNIHGKLDFWQNFILAIK